MLKIKDNVDLKELEKFGFRYYTGYYGSRGYLKELEYNDDIFIYEDNKKVFFEIEDFCGDDWNKFCEELVYDLIKADLVEKVDENSEDNNK